MAAFACVVLQHVRRFGGLNGIICFASMAILPRLAAKCQPRLTDTYWIRSPTAHTRCVAWDGRRCTGFATICGRNHGCAARADHQPCASFGHVHAIGGKATAPDQIALAPQAFPSWDASPEPRQYGQRTISSPICMAAHAIGSAVASHPALPVRFVVATVVSEYATQSAIAELARAVSVARAAAFLTPMVVDRSRCISARRRRLNEPIMPPVRIALSPFKRTATPLASVIRIDNRIVRYRRGARRRPGRQHSTACAGAAASRQRLNRRQTPGRLNSRALRHPGERRRNVLPETRIAPCVAPGAGAATADRRNATVAAICNAGCEPAERVIRCWRAKARWRRSAPLPTR